MSWIPPVPDPALLAGHGIVQICWVVPSLDDAIARWRQSFGIGPWLIMDSAGTADRRYRGQPTDLAYRAALVQSAGVHVELIEQTSTGPSPFREVVPEGRTGLHHVAIVAADYDGELARFAALGLSTAYEARFDDVRFAFVDTTPLLGFMVEVYDDQPMLREMMAIPGRLAKGWDGTTDPVRTIEQVLAVG